MLICFTKIQIKNKMHRLMRCMRSNSNLINFSTIFNSYSIKTNSYETKSLKKQREKLKNLVSNYLNHELPDQKLEEKLKPLKESIKKQVNEMILFLKKRILIFSSPLLLIIRVMQLDS